MSLEEKSEKVTEVAEVNGEITTGESELDVFNRSAESSADQIQTSPTAKLQPDVEGEVKEPEPSGEKSEVSKEEEVELPEEMPAWFDKAVQKVRDEIHTEYEPTLKELRDLKSERGREKKEEMEMLRTEAEQAQVQASEKYKNTSIEVGNQFLMMINALKNVERDENGRIYIVDEAGTQRPVNPESIGQFLLSVSGLSHGLFQDWQQSAMRVTSKIEQVLFTRRPELSKYKAKFNEKVLDLGLELDKVHADPVRVERIYDILMHEEMVSNYPKIKDEAKTAAVDIAKRKIKGISPSGKGVDKSKPVKEEEQVQKEAEESLGGLTAKRRETRVHIF